MIVTCYEASSTQFILTESNARSHEERWREYYFDLARFKICTVVINDLSVCQME
jgi:hypothetical protein